MTSSLHEAKEALGVRLRELRQEAGITGTELARRAGWHQTKVSKIEYGKTKPTETDIRVWCTHTNAKDQIPDLIATVRNIEAAYLEWRRVLGTGIKRRQLASVKLEAGTEYMRWYEPSLVPGLLQTAEYAEEIIKNVIDFYRVANDLDEAVSKRLERQQILYQRKHKFHFLIAEQALYTTVGNNHIMIGQMDRLLAVVSLPRVTFGIVPTQTQYRVPTSNFIIFDNSRVMVETITAEMTITQPREIALYGRAFDTLAKQSVTGDAARLLIRKALSTRTR
ncbi:helix-turn-helix transcriptional regulator [Nocardia terpenica]|nr:helix-turn-helix transcriptional regulator [Nocardia terpenica]MBF6107941.1 helix-turn-helix transcriptional regulator [Nocardia terpenica]MBF6115528.1 helix-turn-helix transcriptional regulator [Nocardia terpenica]MBF6121965.1 helix-turn-helix transcriptional regulator [Nocardia terpenica]MBF6155491.1 helix-turn-helix transcriptional regulator [Nocardia terpenica]